MSSSILKSKERPAVNNDVVSPRVHPGTFVMSANPVLCGCGLTEDPSTQLNIFVAVYSSTRKAMPYYNIGVSSSRG